MNRQVPHPLRWLIGAAAGALVIRLCWRVSLLDEASDHWVSIAILVVAVVVAEALPDARRLLPEPGSLTSVLVLSLFAVYACVPETGHIPGVAAVLIAVAVIESATRHTMPIAWHALAAILILWAAIFGATGRDRAFVGGLFAFWPVVLMAMVVHAVRDVARLGRWARVTIAALGCGAAIFVARRGALQQGRRPAFHDAMLAGAITLGLAMLVTVVAVAVSRARLRSPQR